MENENGELKMEDREWKMNKKIQFSLIHTQSSPLITYYLLLINFYF